MELNGIENHEHASTSLKALLLVFALVLVGVLGYLVWQQNTAPEEVDNSTQSTASVLTYTNTTHGYTMKLNSTWTGYKTSTWSDPDQPTIKNVEFFVPCAASDNCTSDGTTRTIAGYTTVMVVGAYPTKIWNAFPNDEGPTPTRLAANDTYVFGYSHAQAFPVSWETKAVNLKIDTVAATFKLTN